MMLNTSIGTIAAAFTFINAALSLPTVELLTRAPAAVAGTVPRLIQYVQTFHPEGNDSGHLSLLPLINQKTGITHVILAALHINGPNGDITLNDNNPNSTYYSKTWSEAATLQSNGVKVMVMVGGAAQGSFSGRLCNKQTGAVQNQYYSAMASTLKYHKVDGLDLDIEEKVPLACPQNLVNRLRKDFGSNFIITMAPVASDLTQTGGSALGGFSYSQFDKSSAGKQVNWYNGQYYSGFVQGSIEDSYEGAISNGYTANRVVMGILDNSKDGSGFMSISDYEEIITALKGQYSNYGGVDGWEYFDAGGADGLSQPWMWTKQIGQTLFGSSGKRSASQLSGHKHTPPLPSAVAKLMSEGHDQIAAASAVRLAKGDEEAARMMLKES